MTIFLDEKEYSEEALSEIIELIKAKKKNKLDYKMGEDYYCISRGEVTKDTWFNIDIDIWRIKAQLGFRTKEEAEFYLEKQKVLIELKEYAEKYNEKEIIEGNQKIFISLDTFNGILHYSDLYWEKVADQVYFSSFEVARNAVKEIGEYRIKKYLFDYEESEEE